MAQAGTCHEAIEAAFSRAVCKSLSSAGMRGSRQRLTINIDSCFLWFEASELHTGSITLYSLLQF